MAESNQKRQIVIFLYDDFPLLSFSCIIEGLRNANRFIGYAAYEWLLVSPDGSAVTSSAGFDFNVDKALTDVNGCDRFLIVSANSGQYMDDPVVMSKLRKLASSGVEMGSASSGSFILANAGLLDGYRCTIHWENIPVFKEIFTQCYVTGSLVEYDRNMITCAGGTAALDMTLRLIELDFDSELSNQISRMCQHDRLRTSNDQQQMVDKQDLIRLSPKLAIVIELMEKNIEDPLSPNELANYVFISLRQLERLFRKYRSTTPQRYYISLRLQYARQLLLDTSRSGLEVAIASGFASHSHFIKSYRQIFGHTPHEERKLVVYPEVCNLFL